MSIVSIQDDSIQWWQGLCFILDTSYSELWLSAARGRPQRERRVHSLLVHRQCLVCGGLVWRVLSSGFEEVQQDSGGAGSSWSAILSSDG